MKVALLRKVQRQIKASPLRFNIDTWTMTSDDIAPCGTTACIAGWVVATKGRSLVDSDKWVAAVLKTQRQEERYEGKIRQEAIKMLGIDGEQAARLFFLDNWPVKFRHPSIYLRHELGNKFFIEPVDLKKVRRLRKKISALAIRRIEHFIETKGEE